MFFALVFIGQAYKGEERPDYYGICSGLVQNAKYLETFPALILKACPISRVVSQ
jgi:hypothetical protein